MGRPKRADEAGGAYHALNRGNAQATIFEKPEDFNAFERILAEGLSRYPCQLLAYQLMPNHWHLVVRLTADEGSERDPTRHPPRLPAGRPQMDPIDRLPSQSRLDPTPQRPTKENR
ncbi:hypothetical protein C5Y96_11025 [Blastopirellula marina]|uniref:Transposase IS200-like domain-containing protein n=1 Tax=Blastopirellula marina TaxID=124 RepID=A0A2S8FME6_9BACT|nr:MULTISPECIES: transposase [Pirellulaceae]PQO33373.1 hypothetical protein C5Y96_11025 [Blastopirellula marina]RCS52462.1 hypothetical protein DTL36_11035 [Bremerella cremea]